MFGENLSQEDETGCGLQQRLEFGSVGENSEFSVMKSSFSTRAWSANVHVLRKTSKLSSLDVVKYRWGKRKIKNKTHLLLQKGPISYSYHQGYTCVLYVQNMSCMSYSVLYPVLNLTGHIACPLFRFCPKITKKKKKKKRYSFLSQYLA